MLKSTMADNRILQPSAITIVPSVADIFLTIPEPSTIAPSGERPQHSLIPTTGSLGVQGR